MGNYNPNVPHLLGQEWVPIRDEDVVFAPNVNSVELGHGFTLATGRQVSQARFAINDPAGGSVSSPYITSIYARGTEALSGPIRRVVIPCNNGGVTGTGITVDTSVASALLSPDDGTYVRCVFSGGTQDLAMYFATTQYAQLLTGKRILGVRLLYSAYGYNTTNGPLVDTDLTTPLTNVYLGVNIAPTFWYYGGLDEADLLSGSLDGPANRQIHAVSFGNVNHFWNFPTVVTNSSELLPWRYSDLARYEISAGVNRNQVHITFQLPLAGDVFNLGYAALEVFYCEEYRLAVGAGLGARVQDSTGIVSMYEMTYTNSPVLAAGDYTLTIAPTNAGDAEDGNTVRSRYPDLNAVRELYAIPPHPGIQLNIPFPVEDNVGEAFTQETTHILPQISLSASGGPLTEVHVYGRQSVAQVYGTVTATQEVLDSAVGSAVTWPQVRWYARRWGNTTVPLKLDSPSASVSGSGMSVQITPPEWDALPEIIDGWKEITLQFPTPPTMGAGTTPTWRWSAAGELVGNRWEVLGATAPAISGVPGNLLNLIPSPNQLSAATYGAPSAGATVNEGWVPQYAPPVSATADDQTSDAVLIFAQNYAAPGSFTVVGASQAVSGIGLDCGINPCCIPTSINYNQVSWATITGAAGDFFDRTVAAGNWGTSSSGHLWTVVASNPSDFSVNGSKGLVLMNSVNVERRGTVVVGTPDQHVQADLLTPVLATGATLDEGLLLRHSASTDYYWIGAQIETTNSITLRLVKRVGGLLTQVLSVALDQQHSTTVPRTIEAQIVGSTIQARTWLSDQPKPDAWQMTTVDTSLTTGNNAGIIFRATTANTSGTYTAEADNFLVSPIGWGSYELQRDDAYGDWQTIMLATNPGLISFRDCEARIGLASTYRIRAVDSYGFNGTWSSEVSITSTAPGISGGCVADGHILVFTSNEIQDGTSNLAYSSVWEGQVSEDFSFVEASFTQLQTMYNKDFFTAFRPLERGGDRFQRTVLVQAAAIDPLTLSDFTSLRNMAWADIPYVCVRDEDGNRWFATVLVPNGRVRLNRSLYTAQVDVIEVTDTASPVDP